LAMSPSISTFSALALSLLLLCSTVIESGCAPGEPASHAAQEQHCPGGSTPVVDNAWNPHGCTSAPDNVITPGSDCSDFKTGMLTTDRTGTIYECR
jgi:hypothetical protein